MAKSAVPNIGVVWGRMVQAEFGFRVVTNGNETSRHEGRRDLTAFLVHKGAFIVPFKHQLSVLG